MTSPVAVVTRENTVDDCMAIMTKHRFRHLPVVEYSSAVVVVSISDLVKWIISGQAQTIQGQWKVSWLRVARAALSTWNASTELGAPGFPQMAIVCWSHGSPRVTNS